MYFQKANKQKQDFYKSRLQLIAGLSRLFTDSSIPYLYYRVAERIYCDTLEAEDKSRNDIAIDAIFKSEKDHFGVGLKTFLYGNGRTFQKVAEFNKARDGYKDLKSKKLALHIATLRNDRIKFSNNLCSIDKNFYHCVLREENHFHLFEEDMSLISLVDLAVDKETPQSLIFNDGIHEYNFNKSKSTLLKRFICPSEKLITTIDAPIWKDPFAFLEANNNKELQLFEQKEEFVILPLYSLKEKRHVQERSGLNQWNAKGRDRDENELYIPIPKLIHQLYPDFFPKRDEPFQLKLPNSETLSSKVCQSDSKALMSNPNRKLGRWLLRNVLNVPVGELVTIELLDHLGIDSVKVVKHSVNNYSINFSKTGTYDDFIIESLD